ncbi:MAG TPA: hypothetical protein VLT62_03815 [Candidatus Methylomirabilis sp.]|nr:hypothetical protein [Candidatus Methylomirabilis sp.]
MDWTAAQLAEERTERREQAGELRAGISDLRGEIGTVAGIARDLAQVVLRRTGGLEEDRREVRQVFSRMEQQDVRVETMTREIRDIRARMAEHDARFEAMAHDIRRILDAIERRGDDGGRRPS